MSEQVLSMPLGLGAVKVGEMLTLPGLVSKKTANLDQLPAVTQEMIRNVSLTLDSLVLSAIEKRSSQEFVGAWREVFPKYFDGALGLSFLVGTTVPKSVLEVLSHGFFAEVEADFREHGLTAFGAEVRDQAIFTAWTLRKISDISQRISEAPLAVALLPQDQEIFSNFAFHAMVVRFHLHCLYISMHRKQPIYPAVFPVVINGLRSAVDAYAWARRALNLRIPATEQECTAVDWDEEERQLLDEATYDTVADVF